MKRPRRTGSARSPIGLDLGDCVIKAAQVSGGAPGAMPRLTAAMTLDRLRPGEPFDRAEALRLRQVLDRRGFCGSRVAISVPARHAMTSVLTLPPQKDGLPLDRIVRSELAHEHRREQEDFEVAWWELPRPARTSGGTHAMAVGCPHAVADEWIGVLQSAGMEVVGLDLAGWAVARACEPAMPGEPGIVAAVDLGWDSTTLVLLHEGVIAYVRAMFGSGLRHLRKVLETDHEYPVAMIDYLLHDIGFELAQRGHEEDQRLLAKSAGPLQAHYDQVVGELSLALDYAQSQYPSAAVAGVMLLGGGAATPGAADYVAQRLDTPVTTPTPAQVTRDAERFGELARLPALLPAIGLARHGEVASDARKEAA